MTAPMPSDGELRTDAHCPANKAADILGDRWVLRIVRALVMGATRYSDLDMAIPNISPAVLSGRLKQLAENGIIVRRETAGSRAATYHLTPSGRELAPLVKYLAVWGLRWGKRAIKERDFDIGALMWDVHMSLRANELPDGETVISIAFPDVERFPRWWIVAQGNSIDLCSDNPGKDVDVYLTCPVAELVSIWQGQRDVREAMASGVLLMEGRADLLQTVDNWIPVSPVALELSAKEGGQQDLA